MGKGIQEGRPSAAESEESPAHSAGAPGRRTLTESLPRRSSGGGEPLPSSVAGSFSAGLGADLSGVRVHTDDQAAGAAASLSARAFTQGNDIYFARGAYAPDTGDGKRLLAHEVAHTVQQSGGAAGGGPQFKLEMSTPGDPLEREADRAADALVAGRSAGPLSAGAGIHRKTDSEWGVATSADRDDNTAAGVTAQKWMWIFAPLVQQKMAEWLIASEFKLPTTYAVWKGGTSKEFVKAFWAQFQAIGGKGWVYATLGKVMAPDKIDEFINAGRDTSIHEKTDPYLGDPIQPRGPMAWNDNVVGEIGKILVKRIIESLPRIMPGYLHAKSQLALAAEKEKKKDSPDPKKDQVIGSHPIDPYVIDGLATNIDFNLAAYRAANLSENVAQDPAQLGKSKTCKIEWQHRKGAWNWLRVTDPPGATKEDVAFTLYGESTFAHTLSDAAPLFGFTNTEDLTESIRDDYWGWADKSPVQPSVGDDAVDPSPEAQILDGPLGDEIALNQARSVKASKVQASADGRLAIVERIRGMLGVIDRLEAEEQKLPAGAYAYNTQAVKKRLEGRSAKMMDAKTPIDEVIKWDGQTQAQLSLLNSALNGVVMTNAQHKAFESWPKASGLLQFIGYQYIQVAALSDLNNSAKDKLAYADEQSKLFPVTLMELVLAEVRKAMHTHRGDKTGVFGDSLHDSMIDAAEHEKREAKLRDGLAKIRAKLLQDPTSVKEDLKKLVQELSDLQAEVSIVTDMESMDVAWKALYDDLSVVGVLTRTNNKDSDKMDALVELNSQWRAIYHKYRSGQKAEAKKELEEKRPQWTQLYEDIKKLIKSNQTLNRWVTFAILVGIAIITAGVGAYVEGLAGAAWGATSFATFAVTTGAEALAFTSMSYLIVEKDPSIGGFFLELGKNILVFGALKGITNKYIAGMGEAQAATLAGKAELMVVQFVTLNAAALTEAQIKKKLSTGEDLTPDEVLSISKENALFLFATSVLMIAARPGIESLKLQGVKDGTIHKYNAIKTELLDLGKQIESNKGTGNFEQQSRDLLAKQRELLKAEEAALQRLEKMASDPKLAKQAGLDTIAMQEKVLKMRSEHDALAAAMKPASVLANTEGTGAVRWIEAGEKFKEAVEMYEGQKADGTKVTPLVSDPVTGAKGIEVTTKEGETFRLMERKSIGDGVVAQGPKVGKLGPTAEEVALRQAAVEQAKAAMETRIKNTKALVDGVENPYFEHGQIGGDIAAVINQATLPKSKGGAAGAHDGTAWPKMLSISDKPEVWRDRGPVNQTPGELDAPGVRVSDLTTNQHGYTDAPVLADAIMQGRYETGMSLYEGRAVSAVESNRGQADWAVPQAKVRVKVRVKGMPDRYFYFGSLDLTVGPGPSAGIPDAVVKGGKTGAAYTDMLSDGRIFYGDQAPTKVLPGDKVMVWGGSGNGAAMAEHYAKAGKDVTWVARESKRDPAPQVKPELAAIEAELKGPVSAERKKELLARKKELMAFGRAMLPRNVEEAFDSPLAKEKIHRTIDEVEAFEPIEVNGKKKVRVKLQNGGEKEFDQVIVSLGQNPDAEGAAGHLIGNHQMEMMLDGEGHLVGLKSHPDGLIVLKGSAFADPKLEPHLIPDQRAEFRRKVAEEADRLPANSRGVAPSVANAAITISGANDAVAVQNYRLPGDTSSIQLKAGQEALWPEQIATFLGGEMGIDPARINVETINDGKSGDPVFRVRVGVEDLGIFKIFKSPGEAATEIALLKMVSDKKLKNYKVVGEKGTVRVTGDESGLGRMFGQDEAKGGMMMETAQGTSVDGMIKNLGTEPTARADAMAKLREAIVKVAKGMAEFHKAFESGEHLTDAQKLNEVNYIKLQLDAIKDKIGEAHYNRLKSLLETKVIDPYMKAKVPATAYHGDANTGNFIIAPDGSMRVIDVGTMRHSMKDGKVQGTGGADVGRFLESLESRRPGGLTPDEVTALTELFKKTYFGEYKGKLSEADMAHAIELYRAQMEISLIRDASPDAKTLPATTFEGPLGRLDRLLGIPPEEFKPTPVPVPRDDDKDKKKTAP